MLFVLSVNIFGQREPDLRVERIAVCKSVENHEPVGVDSVFFDDVEQLSCFTEISGAQDTTQIRHVWYYGKKLMTTISLDVKLPSWRTWSTKTIVQRWEGDWFVEVMDSRGNLLAREKFEIKKASKK
jgi:hypothetical protein